MSDLGILASVAAVVGFVAGFCIGHLRGQCVGIAWCLKINDS